LDVHGGNHIIREGSKEARIEQVRKRGLVYFFTACRIQSLSFDLTMKSLHVPGLNRIVARFTETLSARMAYSLIIQKFRPAAKRYTAYEVCKTDLQEHPAE